MISFSRVVRAVGEIVHLFPPSLSISLSPFKITHSFWFLCSLLQKWQNNRSRRWHGDPSPQTAVLSETRQFSATSAGAGHRGRSSRRTLPHCRRFGGCHSPISAALRPPASTKIWRCLLGPTCTTFSWASSGRSPRISPATSCSEKAGSERCIRVILMTIWGRVWRLSRLPSSFSTLKAYRDTANGL